MLLVTSCLVPVALFSFIRLSQGQQTNLPKIPLCGYPDDATKRFLDCLVKNIDKKLVDKTLQTIRTLFGTDDLFATLREMCQANNNDSKPIIDAVAEDMTNAQIQKAIPKVLECHQKNFPSK